jgi:hypothetical protein
MNMNKAYIMIAVDVALWIIMLGLTWHYVTCPLT